MPVAQRRVRTTEWKLIKEAKTGYSKSGPDLTPVPGG